MQRMDTGIKGTLATVAALVLVAAALNCGEGASDRPSGGTFHAGSEAGVAADAGAVGKITARSDGEQPSRWVGSGGDSGLATDQQAEPICSLPYNCHDNPDNGCCKMTGCDGILVTLDDCEPYEEEDVGIVTARDAGPACVYPIDCRLTPENPCCEATGCDGVLVTPDECVEGW